MKKIIITCILVLSILMATVPSALAVSMQVDGEPVSVSVSLYDGTSYVPIRAVTNLLCPDADVSWENGQAVITTPDLSLTARPGDDYLIANGRILYVQDGVKNINAPSLCRSGYWQKPLAPPSHGTEARAPC